MRILVTGAGGLLGSALVRQAQRRGHDVVALDRAALDVTDASSVARTVASAAPDAVVNCAAYTAVDRAEAEPELARLVNRDGARNVAAACAAVGAVPVYVSTDYVFDGALRTPYRTDAPTAPLGAYGATKLEGERATAEAAPEHLTVRMSWLYGGDNGFVPAILRRAEAGRPLRVVSDQEGRPTWAPHAAEALLDLVERGARGTYHVAAGGACSWLELAREAVRAAGLDVPVRPVTTEEFRAAARRPPYSVLDLTDTESLLGRAMPDWHEGLRGFLENRNG
jgi:dTDP-4-dehydrorhamnose reductase